MDARALAVECPECGEGPEVMCRILAGPLSGQEARWPHVPRITSRVLGQEVGVAG